MAGRTIQHRVYRTRRSGAPQGQSFAVVAEDPELAGGIEFALYADLVADEMERLGYAESATAEAANLLVRFDYNVDNGRERVRTDGFGGGYLAVSTLSAAVLAGAALGAAVSATAMLSDFTIHGSPGRKSAATPSTPAISR